MKGCKDCEARHIEQYNAQMVAMDYVPGSQDEQYSYRNPQTESDLAYKSNGQRCSICDKGSSLLVDRSYGVEHLLLCKYRSEEWLYFKGICSNCSNYISSATAEDVVGLYKELSKKNNPFRKKEKKSFWRRK